MYQFSGKRNNFEFFGPNLLKNGFRVENSENWCWKMNNFDFFEQNLPKNWFWGWDFSGFEICILETLCVPIFRQNGQIWIFGPKFSQKWILRSKLQNAWIWNQHPWDTVCTNLQIKQRTLNFWAQIFPKMDFGVGISKVKI